MKLFAKTFGWAILSSLIFFSAAVSSGAPVGSALIATLVAVMTKTPVYPIWEIVFHKLWPSENPQAEPLQLVADTGEVAS